jgi:DNA-binding SARP family transcriptional activator
VLEFGRAGLQVGGREVAVGLTKSLELLAFLVDDDREDVPRERLLDALFEGRRDASAVSYLRQAVLKLRKAMPDVLAADTRPGVVRLSQHVRVTSESRRLIAQLGEATASRGAERLRLLLAALQIADRGAYLPAVTSVWAEERRRRLDELVRSARLEAGEVAFATGSFDLARRLAAQVVADDPYREAGWRLLMRLAHALGDHDRVIAAFRSCEQALAELGARPSSTTRGLLRDSGA